MSKTFDEITTEITTASDEMLKSLLNDELVDHEKMEWYGYLRALRDISYFMGVSDKTGTQEKLLKALSMVVDKNIASKL